MKNCTKNKETNVLPLGGMYKRILLQHSTKKFFSNFIRPFLVNKGSLNSSEIMLRKGKKIITDTKEIVQVLNGHYINIAERSCWEKPPRVAKQSYFTHDTKIVRHYEDHPSVTHIKKNVKTPQKLYLFFVNNI